MTDLFDILTNSAFWVAVLRIATPLILGTLGVLLCERAGVLNLGIEGIMVAGAFTGWLTVYAGAPLWIGVLAAALTGALLGLLHAFLGVVQKVLFSGNTDVAIPPSGIRDLSFSTMEWQQAG
jgi:simple sugar transport system permease protein